MVEPGTTLVAFRRGPVIFCVGSRLIGSGSLTTTAGVTSANFSTYSLSVGSHSITASYADDSNFNPSTSSAVTQVVSKIDTTNSLTSATDPTRIPPSTCFTATVSVVAP